MKTKGKSQNRWFFDDSIDDFLMISLSFFEKIIPRPFPQIIKKSPIESSKNHRVFNNSQECYPKSSKNHRLNHQVPEKWPGIILESIIFSTCPRKATQNHPRNHPNLISVHKSP
jgi:hypothetical protein